MLNSFEWELDIKDEESNKYLNKLRNTLEN
jgi:hypothetical protein